MVDVIAVSRHRAHSAIYELPKNSFPYYPEVLHDFRYAVEGDIRGFFSRIHVEGFVHITSLSPDGTKEERLQILNCVL